MSTMSSRKNKKRNNDKTENNSSNTTANGAHELSSVTFKYPGRFATLTRAILLNENLTINELQRKVILTASQQPPDEKKVFEIFYMDEIYPFINKHAQETINNKKAISKTWEIQTNHFKKIYIRRSELLRTKWNEIRNKKSSYNVTNHHHHHSRTHNNNNNNNDSNSQTVIFKYYSVHSSAKTNRHIFITSPTKEELLTKIQLTGNSNPPTAKEVFELYYYDEILPFLKKSGQQSIRGKKDLSKVWQIQTKTFKGLYEDRAKILLEEWNNLKKKKTKNNKKQTKKSRSASQLLDKHQQEKVITYKKHYSHMSHNINNRINNRISKPIRLECRLIRTLLNFLIFVECTTKQDCFMLLIDDQNDKPKKYNKFTNYLNDSNINVKVKLTYFHIRLFIDNFDIDSLRLHTGEFKIKLNFINPLDKSEELCIFELKWNNLCNWGCELNEKIDHEHIEANLDNETRIISINVPILGIS